MFLDDLKICASRSGVLLALCGAISIGPVVCFAQVAPPQKAESGRAAPEDRQVLSFDEFMAEQELQKRANAGDAEAQFRLGIRLSEAFNFDKDGNLAVSDGAKWLQRAAKQGHAGAKLRLAEMAAKGGAPTSGAKTDFTPPVGGFVDFDKSNPGGAQSEPSPPRSILAATGIVAVAALLALLCGYVFWTALGKSVKGSTPLPTARRWMNWVVAVTCVTTLTKFFSQLLGGYGNPWNVLALGVLGTVVSALVAFGLGALWAYLRNRKSSTTELPKTSTSGTTLQHSARMSDNQSFLAASEEVESGKIDKGLWARLYAETDGDEAKTKARYIKFRASQIGASSVAQE